MKFDRTKIMEGLKHLVNSGKLGLAKEIPADAKLVVTRVKDFDPDWNDVWELQKNKSYPREGMICSECGFDVVMSDGMFEMYSNSPHPEMVICNKCIMEIL